MWGGFGGGAAPLLDHDDGPEGVGAGGGGGLALGCCTRLAPGLLGGGGGGAGECLRSEELEGAGLAEGGVSEGVEFWKEKGGRYNRSEAKRHARLPHKCARYLWFFCQEF